MASAPSTYRPVTDKNGNAVDFLNEILRVEDSKPFRDALTARAGQSRRSDTAKVKFNDLKEKPDHEQIGLFMELTLEGLLRDGRLYGPSMDYVGDVASGGSGGGGGGPLRVQICSMEQAENVPLGGLLRRAWECRPRLIDDYLFLVVANGDRLRSPKFRIVVSKGSRCEVKEVLWNGVTFPPPKSSVDARYAATAKATATATCVRVVGTTESGAKRAKLSGSGTAISAYASGMYIVASPKTPRVIKFSLVLAPTVISLPVPIPLSDLLVPAPAQTNGQPPPFRSNWFKDVVVREMLRPMLRAHNDSSSTFDFEETDAAFYLKDEQTDCMVPMPGSLLKHLTSSPRVLGKESITVYIYVEGVSQVAFAMKQVEAVSAPSAHAPPVVSPVSDSRSSSASSLKPASSDGTKAQDVAGLPTDAADAVGTAAPADLNPPSAPTTGCTSAFDEVGTPGSSITEESDAAAVDSRCDDSKKVSASIPAAPHAGVDQLKLPASSSSTIPQLKIAPPSQEVATLGQGGATPTPKTAATDTGAHGTEAASRNRELAERGADPVPMEAVSSMSGPPQPSLCSTWAAASISSLRLPVGTMATTSDLHVRDGRSQAAEDFRSLFSIASDDDDDDDDDDDRSRSDNKNKRIVV